MVVEGIGGQGIEVIVKVDGVGGGRDGLGREEVNFVSCALINSILLLPNMEGMPALISTPIVFILSLLFQLHFFYF